MQPLPLAMVGLTSSVMLSGCTVGPDYRMPRVEVPAAYAEARGAGSTSDSELGSWWLHFRDPLLSDLVGRALSQNLDVGAARARLREARAREQVAGAAVLPQASGEASVTRQRISENAIPAPPGATGGEGTGAFALPGAEFTSWRPGFDASWEVDLFGRTRRSIEAARARTGEALWNRRDVEVTVAAEVASAYLGLRTLQERIAAAGAELDRQQRFERLVAARTRGGLVTGQDLAQQRSERAAAAAAIPSLEAEARAKIHALGILTGEAPEALIAQLAPPLAIPPAAPAVPVGLPSELLRRRPDIRAAERALAASTADIGVAVADLYPRFSLTAAPALVSTALASLVEWGSRSYSAGAVVDWPIFDGGLRRGNIAIANARSEQALIAYRKAVLVALKDVEDALARTDGDRRHLSSVEEALGTARRAEDIARSRYRGGLVTYSDVLLAQQRRLKLEDDVALAKGSLAENSVSLFKALGGGWPGLSAGGAQP